MSSAYRIPASTAAPLALPPGTIERAVAREIEQNPAALVILEAPAGYGKSTALMQAFIARVSEGGDAVWLSLDDHSEDARTFLAALVRAMVHLRLELGSLQDQAARDFAGTSLNPAIVQLIEAIAQSERRITFFVDNLDDATEAVIPVVGRLAQQLAPACKFVVATRVHARSGLAKLKAAGAAVVFRSSDLRFTRDEGRQFLKEHTSTSDADAIVDWVEGWPVMVQLVRLSIGRDGNMFGAMPKISSGSGDLAEYLAEQVLQSLPIETQMALMYLSVCERFNGDTLNALCGRKDGWNAIAEFVARGLLLVPLDGGSIWHRFHPIFGEFLLERLRRGDPDAVVALHRQAADWFAGQGLVNDAIRHANAAGNIEFTTRLLAEAGGWLVAFRGGTKALRIIADLPDEILEEHPYLRLGQIYLLAQESQLKVARSAFKRLMEQVQAPSSFPSSQARHLFDVSAGVLDALLCVYEVKRVDPEKLLALQAQCGPGIPDQLAVMITHLLGFAYYCDGNYLQARRICPVAAEQCEAVGAAFVAVYSYLALGDTYLEMAELDRAEHYFNVANRIATDNFGSHSNQVTASQIFLAEVAYERNDIELASTLIKRSLPGIEHRDPWSSVYMSGHRVAAELIKRERGWREAIQFLEEAMTRLQAHELYEIYAPYLKIKISEIYATAGLVGAASWPLVDGNLQPENREQQRSRSELLRMLASTRLTLLQGGGNVTLRQLGRMLPSLRVRNQKRRILKVYVLNACAFHQQGQYDEADRAITAAVELAATTGMIAPIIEERALLEPLLRDSRVAAGQLASLGIDTCTAMAPFSMLDVERETCEPVPGKPVAEVPPPRPREGPSLSKREAQVLTMLADGMSGKEIAIEINISLNTVMGYRKSLYRKLDTSSRSGAIAVGRRLGWLAS